MPLRKEKKMKKIIFPLALLLLVACGQRGQKVSEVENVQEIQDTQKEKRKGPFAQIEFPEGTDYDFGIYSEREEKTHDFLVRNPSKFPLIINKVEAACPCTKVTGPKKPILEGQVDTIHVRYDGNGFLEGYYTKHITVYANIEEEAIGLKITGHYIDNEK